MTLSFKEKIYNIVKKIPKGKTMTYKQVASLAGKPGAYRAVGNILNKNYDKSIPCHRVIRSDGKIGGYNRGAKKKIDLLKSENVVVRSQKVFWGSSFK
jgi:O-6-methylguanine DNA methyltransferase